MVLRVGCYALSTSHTSNLNRQQQQVWLLSSHIICVTALVNILTSLSPYNSNKSALAKLHMASSSLISLSFDMFEENCLILPIYFNLLKPSWHVTNPQHWNMVEKIWADVPTFKQQSNNIDVKMLTKFITKYDEIEFHHILLLKLLQNSNIFFKWRVSYSLYLILHQNSPEFICKT